MRTAAAGGNKRNPIADAERQAAHHGATAFRNAVYDTENKRPERAGSVIHPLKKQKPKTCLTASKASC